MVWTVGKSNVGNWTFIEKHDVMTRSRSHTEARREMRIILVALMLSPHRPAGMGPPLPQPDVG